MRVLFLSNYYPPVANGGYEQLCQETAIAFVRRGHDVSVLTSRSSDGIESVEDEGVQVRRQLYREVDGGVLATVARLWWDRDARARRNCDQVKSILASFHPDVVLIWGMWNIPRSVPAEVEAVMPGRVVYYLCDYWPSLPSAYLQQVQGPSTRPLSRVPKELAARLAMRRLGADRGAILRFEHPLCVSQAVRDLLVSRGVPVENARVIPNGIRVDDFASVMTTRTERVGRGLRLLYAGRLSSEKGVDTAIQAMSEVADRESEPGVSLDIVGGGRDGYVRELKTLVGHLGVGEHVHFREPVPRTEMPVLLAAYDALLFTSTWPEPSARTVMEAMAAGLVVVGTTTGATGEILVNMETGLTFAAGDSADLAAQIQRLRENPDWRGHLTTNAWSRVAEKYSFKRMADDLEQYLRGVVDGLSRSRAAEFASDSD